MTLREQALLAKEASYKLSLAGVSQKNEALLKIADCLLANTDYILAENEKDIANAEEIFNELKLCADIIAKTDSKMQNINKRISNS